MPSGTFDDGIVRYRPAANQSQSHQQQNTNNIMTNNNSQQRFLPARWLIPFTTALVAISIALWLPSGKQVNPIIAEELATNANPDETINTTVTDPPINNDEECSCSIGSSIEDSTHSFASSFGLHQEDQQNVSDCCCSHQALEQTNVESVHPLLQRIVTTPFFSHFKIDLCSTCQLWEDAPLCILKDCSVCECEQPPEWAHEGVEWMPPNAGPDPDCEHVDDRVVTTVDPTMDWTADPSSFLDLVPTIGNEEEPSLSMMVKDDNMEDNNNSNNAVVVDLRLNPERYTGYSGHSAEKVWSAIHADNCFQPLDNNADPFCSTLPPEQRVYNRIVSGLHSSISLHIAHSYCLEVNPDRPWECENWGVNEELAAQRVLDHPDRVENLYVAFATVLRAVQKAGSAVTAAVPMEDHLFSDSLSEWTDSLLPELTKLAQTCPLTFDESSLVPKDDDEANKRLELQRRFRHLQQIMECVGCDRCKLWGTLQTLGIGTALRVLLHDNDTAALNLTRQEAVALVHTLERLSSSLVFAREFRGGGHAPE